MTPIGLVEVIPSAPHVFTQPRVGAQMQAIGMADKMLSPVEFRLMTLLDRERTGRQLARHYRERTGTKIPYGTLYSSFRRLRQRRWLRMREVPDGDRRARLFSLTAEGTEALRRTRSHYEDLIAFARTS